MEIEVKDDNFESEVINSKIPVLVDFWAPWCGPCKQIAPHIKELANEQKGKLKVCKINVDEAPQLATKYTVMSIPTVMVFKDGKIMDKKVGSMGKRELEKIIRSYL